MNNKSESVIKRSKLTSLFIALISYFSPGYGQFVAGRLKSAIAISFAGAVLILYSNDIDQPIKFFLACCYTPFIVFVCIHAYFINSSKQGIVRKSFNKWYFNVAFVATYLILVSILIMNVARVDIFSTYTPYSIVNVSNTPMLAIGDRVMSKNINLTDESELKKHFPRGSFAIFLTPKEIKTYGKAHFIKRIIAFPGERPSIRQGVLYINNKPVSEAYVDPANNTQTDSVNLAPVIIPKGYVFVLGDNRDNSEDSRQFGLVPMNNITGKVLYIFWSHDLAKIGKIDVAPKKRTLN